MWQDHPSQNKWESPRALGVAASKPTDSEPIMVMAGVSCESEVLAYTQSRETLRRLV